MDLSVPRLMYDAHRTRRQGNTEETRRHRLAGLIADARARSPYYRELYRDLPPTIDDVTMLPVTGKQQLMSNYDEWATDRAITREDVGAFTADPANAGRPYRDDYLVVTTSGTTGSPAIFVKDQRDVSVNLALTARMMMSWLGAADLARIVTGGGRMAIVAATGGHFLVSAGAARLADGPFRRRAPRLLSVHTPLPELVTALNTYRPALLLGYGSVLRMLAAEQQAGRLRISPVLVEPAGESLSPEDHARMATAFGAKVRDTYGASECPYLTEGCAEGWYHLNSDWAILEPVEADHTPTPVGRPSHSVLITNLANRVQPILRYDLGDSVVQRPDPCPCGNPPPAVRVEGRSAHVLRFGTTEIPPLALNTTVDTVPGVQQYQIVQTGPSGLALRLRTTAGADEAAVRQRVGDTLAELLRRYGLGQVTVDHVREPPQQSAGGKYRTVIPWEEPA